MQRDCEVKKCPRQVNSTGYIISTTQTSEVKVKIGDLVRIRWTDDNTYYRNVRVGDHLIYIEKGSWHGWGRFLLPDGTKGQIAFADVEVVCK